MTLFAKKIIRYVCIALCFIIAALLCMILSTITSRQATLSTTGAKLYFMESSTSLLKPEIRDIGGETEADKLANALKELKNGPKIEGFTPTIPKEVEFKNINIDRGVITVDVSAAYGNMKAGAELICRASVVKTLTDLGFVNGVKITAEGEEITRANGKPIGVMKADDIITEGIIYPEPLNYETVTLYFADGKGKGLVAENRQIEVNPNEPIEKYIVEQLIAGPQEKGNASTIPTETKIRSIKTERADNICYVDLSSEFMSKHTGGYVNALLTIYSIVNSLTELETVNKVQFLIEGEKVDEYKGNIEFGKPFEPMPSLNN